MIARFLCFFTLVNTLFLSIGQPVNAEGNAADHVKRATVKIVIRDQNNVIRGTGSGVIISPQGYIITARHVVSEYYKTNGSTKVFVRRVDENLILGPENLVTVFDPDSGVDLALLRLTAIDLPFIKVGHSSTIPLDEKLLAYGFPLGSDDVSSKPGRRSNAHWEVDNPISPGFSGGPVVKDGCDILIGIAQGGLETSPAALLPGRSLIVPIQYGATLLAKAEVSYTSSLCEGEGGPATSHTIPPQQVILIQPVDSSSLSQDAKYIGDKVHRNLAELLNNSGHHVNAPPLSVAISSSSSRISNIFTIRLAQDGNNMAIHVALTTADGFLLSSTELTGPLPELKEIYKVIPEAILFGLDVDERTLRKKNTAKLPTKSIEAYAHYLHARRKLSSGDTESAQIALRKSIILDRNFALANWSLGTLLADQGRTSEGHELLEEANRLDPDHPKILLTSPSQQSHPIPTLMSAIQASEAQELEAGFVFRKAASKDYGIEIRSWAVDSSRFDIGLVEQKSPHGSNISEFLEDANAILAVNGGFFEIDHLKRISPAGALVIDGIIRNASLNKQSGALVQKESEVKIIWASALEPLTAYKFALQTGPILVESQGKLGIKKNDYDRLNRAAVCSRDNMIVFVTLHGLHGNGLSLYEFAELLGAREVDGGLGCTLALNLDGGPSTQVAMKFGGVKEQIDGLWKIHNAIVIRKK